MSSELRRLELKAEQTRIELSNLMATGKLHGSHLKQKQAEIFKSVQKSDSFERRLLKELGNDETQNRSVMLERLMRRSGDSQKIQKEEGKTLRVLEGVQLGLTKKVKELSLKLEKIEDKISVERSHSSHVRHEQASERVSELTVLERALSNHENEIFDHAQIRVQNEPATIERITLGSFDGQNSSIDSAGTSSNEPLPIALNSNLGSIPANNRDVSLVPLLETKHSATGSSQISTVSSHNNQSVELKVDNFQLGIREGERGAISVEISAGSERERRGLWAARQELERELKAADVKVESFRVLRHG